MIDHIILTVSDVDRSLAFYEASLAPLNIKFFMPYKGENGHPDLWGFGDGTRAFFWLKQGKPDPHAIHWGFKAENNNRSRRVLRSGNRCRRERQHFTAFASGILSRILRSRCLRPGWVFVRSCS
jgi:catechol 2,3-dioxygenase-like lactoylglutathione lyase family enzyme